MTIRKKRCDIQFGECFRHFEGAAAYTCEAGYGLPPADDLPAGWYRIGLATMKCDVEVELLENWRTHPIPTPITADRLYGGIARDHTREAVKPRSNPRFKSPSAKAQAQTALRDAEWKMQQNDRSSMGIIRFELNTVERAAWSAALRAKVEASKERDRTRIVVQNDEDF